MNILTIANQKGGTAKSTTAAALAQAAAGQGKRTLAIDLDPQGNLSFFLKADTRKASSLDLLEGKPLKEVLQPAGRNLDAVAASWNLQTISSSRGSARRLKAALEPAAGQYDLIIIDTPPTAGELQNNALMAATDLIIPLQADTVGLQGLYQMTDTARQVQKGNPALTLTGFILTRYRANSRLAKQMTQLIKNAAAAMGIPFLGVIREAVAVQEAQALQQNLFDYSFMSNPAMDYNQLLRKITERKV